MVRYENSAPEPITESRDTIAGYLHELNTAALIMSIVHMTGSTRLLQELPTPRTIDVVAANAESGEEVLEGGFTRAQVDRVHEEALKAIEDYRERGFTLPELDSAQLDTLYRYMCGRDVDDEYLEFIREEIALDGVDRRGLSFSDPELRQRAAEFPVVVIGAGMGGVLAGIRLGEAGIPYTVIEKNPGVGGTWYENRYPGCRVDVPGHSYSYSFAPNHDWSSHFPLADEIRAYYEHCAEHYGVMPHIRFRTEVVAAVFDEERQLWQVEIQDAEGKRETLTAAAVISAVGQLNRPKFPDIPGLDGFQGEVVHSGAWPKGLSLDGQRVAVIGSGASAFQIIPEMAKTSSKLTVFQRSPAWMFPNPGYHTPVGEGQKWALRKLPFYSKWYRFWLFYTSVEGVYDKTLMDPSWQRSDSVSAANDEMRQALTAWIESQVQDPALLKKVLPTYPPFGKRILQDNGTYLEALQKDNVELVTEGIVSIEPNAVRTADGRLHEVDAIVCATGFHADRFLFPMKIVGRGGVELSDQWGETNGRAYLGITVPNFPNLFCIYGPNTNLVVAGSIAHNCESQVTYILRCIELLLREGQHTVECRQEIHDAYNERVDAVNAGTAWGAPQVENWYKNDAGRVTANLPFRIIDYWKMTHRLHPEDYVVR
ncbi:MAG: 4-hydroxyacetophenone monooxygenase [Haliea sp.]|nr:4-hydroxyacetophenone monooxygenase [Haliea sp.]|tara:strand:+ start:9899 stop:11857 length:1959 start_codon:yes stop_codon:yes gene_type:complete